MTVYVDHLQRHRQERTHGVRVTVSMRFMLQPAPTPVRGKVTIRLRLVGSSAATKKEYYHAESLPA